MAHNHVLEGVVTFNIGSARSFKDKLSDQNVPLPEPANPHKLSLVLPK